MPLLNSAESQWLELIYNKLNTMGIVNSVVAGSGIDVNNANPSAPIVSILVPYEENNYLPNGANLVNLVGVNIAQSQYIKIGNTFSAVYSISYTSLAGGISQFTIDLPNGAVALTAIGSGCLITGATEILPVYVSGALNLIQVSFINGINLIGTININVIFTI